MTEEKKKDKPKSIVLEVQSLRHMISTSLKDKREEKDDGEKHT